MFHVFARNRRHAAHTDLGAWFHEITVDTRDDAKAEAENLRFHGYTVQVMRASNPDPLPTVRKLNAPHQ